MLEFIAAFHKARRTQLCLYYNSYHECYVVRPPQYFDSNLFVQFELIYDFSIGHRAPPEHSPAKRSLLYTQTKN